MCRLGKLLGLFFCFVLAGIPPWPLMAAQAIEPRVGVLIGREIRPFVEMVEGLESSLATPSFRHFFDPGGRPYSLAPGSSSLADNRYESVVAVGPEALIFLAELIPVDRLIYSMVLNPESVIGALPGLCGMPLAIGIDRQFGTIRLLFPQSSRVGVLYNPTHNQEWILAAATAAERHRLTLIPLPVAIQADLNPTVNSLPGKVDVLLFIPDPTVIAHQLIEHIIKQTLLAGIPAIGYNRFFHESGAAASFVLDYRALGEATGHLVNARIAGEECRPPAAPFDILINEQVFKLLGLPPAEKP